jgi:hypothetical protein
MIVTEYFKTRDDGIVLHRTYSDIGMMIERDGVRYDEAVDPAELGRTYIETDEPVVGDELSDSQALYILTGGAYGEA